MKKKKLAAARAAVVGSYDLLGEKQITAKDVVFVKREKNKETPYFAAYKMQVAGVSQTVLLPKKKYTKQFALSE